MKKNRKGLMLVLSSPSGAGKTTICKEILKKIKELKLSISYTTRPKRKSEVDGLDYFFVPKKNLKNFRQKIFLLKMLKFLIICMELQKILLKKTYLKELMYFLTLIGRVLRNYLIFLKQILFQSLSYHQAI